MEQEYCIGVANRYALFLEESCEEDPFDLISKIELKQKKPKPIFDLKETEVKINNFEEPVKPASVLIAPSKLGNQEKSQIPGKGKAVKFVGEIKNVNKRSTKEGVNESNQRNWEERNSRDGGLLKGLKGDQVDEKKEPECREGKGFGDRRSEQLGRDRRQVDRVYRRRIQGLGEREETTDSSGRKPVNRTETHQKDLREYKGEKKMLETVRSRETQTLRNNVSNTPNECKESFKATDKNEEDVQKDFVMISDAPQELTLDEWHAMRGHKVKKIPGEQAKVNDTIYPQRVGRRRFVLDIDINFCDSFRGRRGSRVSRSFRPDYRQTQAGSNDRRNVEDIVESGMADAREDKDKDFRDTGNESEYKYSRQLAPKIDDVDEFPSLA